jgi:3-oxoacyl-[acyl-carrier protein] reductase
MGILDGKVAIITGGAQGIGWATAELFSGEGAQVVIWDIDAEKGEKAARSLNENGGQSLFTHVDTTELNSVTTAAEEAHQKFGRIDILINNAGITRDASMKKMQPDQWQQVIDVNLTGVFNCGKAVFPYMIENGGGRIINASSVVAHNGNFGQSNYVATKAGVIGLTKVWAREFGRKGILVNAVAPGFIETEMILTVPENILDGLRSKTPLGRLGQPSDIANAYLFLSSDKASYITGTVLNVDGGLIL